MTSIDEHCEMAGKAGGVSGSRRRGVLLFVLPFCALFGAAVFMGVYSGAKQTEEFKTRAVEARAKLSKSYKAESIDDLLELSYDECDIATAALLVEKEVRPDLDIVACRRMIDTQVDRFLEELPWGVGPEWAIRQLNQQVLDVDVSGEGGRSGMLSSVLLDKKGNCLGLTTFYIAFARRLGIDLQMVSIPGHVFAWYRSGTLEMYVEPAGHGKIHGVGYWDEVRQKIKPSLPTILNSVQRNLGVLMFNRSSLRELPSEYDEAIADLEMACQMAQGGEKDEYTARLRILRYKKLLRDERLHAVEMYPGDEWAEGGGNPIAGSEVDEEIEHFTDSIRRDPDDAHDYFSRAQRWMELEEYKKAVADYTKTIAVCDGIFVGSFLGRGKAWLELDEYDKAIEDFTVSLRRFPTEDDSPYEYRAFALCCKREYAKAEADALKAIELDEDNGLAKHVLGWARGKLGKQ